MAWYNSISNIDFTSYDTFRSSVMGKGWDLDGEYGAQCWDGCDTVYVHIGKVLRTAKYYGGNGYAKTCFSDSRCREYNGESPMIIVYNLSDVKRGDELFFDPVSVGGVDYIGIEGHCGFADEVYQNTGWINLLGQNQWPDASPGNGGPFNIQNLPINSFLGAFRYSVWDGEVPPEPPTPPTPKPLKITPGTFPWVLTARNRRLSGNFYKELFNYLKLNHITKLMV